jgi:hypothetical protein
VSNSQDETRHWTRTTSKQRAVHQDPARPRRSRRPNEEHAGCNSVGQIIPAAKQYPGFKNGYWLVDETGKGMAVVLFENKDALQASDAPAEAVREQAKQLGVTIDSVETFEVIGHA